jgi:hypothetical protein
MVTKKGASLVSAPVEAGTNKGPQEMSPDPDPPGPLFKNNDLRNNGSGDRRPAGEPATCSMSPDIGEDWLDLEGLGPD